MRMHNCVPDQEGGYVDRRATHFNRLVTALGSRVAMRVARLG
ncbi:hypothetical protein [Salinisphaera sp. S4-8]